MRSVLTAIFLAFTLLLSQHHAAPKDAVSDASQKAQDKKNPETNPGVPSSGDTNKADCGSKTSNGKNETPQWMQTLNAIYLLSAPALLIIGIGTAAVVYRQLVSQRNIERAWIVVKRKTSPTTVEWHASINEPYRWWMFEFCNRGNTPARLIDGKMRFSVFDKLPPEPDYGDMSKETRLEEMPFDGRFIGPNDTFGMTQAFRTETSFFLTDEEVNKVKRGELTYCCYAIVLYRDTFGHERETRVCYVWHVPTNLDGREGFLLGGPRKYNRHT